MDEQKYIQTEEAKRKSQQRRRLWGSLFTEGESEAGESKSLTDVVRQINIDGRWFFQQIPGTTGNH